MHKQPHAPKDSREQLRQQWLQQAGAAFDLYFDGGPQPPPVGQLHVDVDARQTGDALDWWRERVAAGVAQ